MTFEDLGLLPELLKAVSEAGYSEPTPIQAQAIPVVLAGQDVMGAAQTGTGKTAGFTLPLLQRLAKYANTSVSPARHPVRALILTPTRELGVQVFESVRTYGRFLPLRSMVAYGGVPIEPQMEDLRKGVEILVATPGRLLDHVERRTVTFTNVEVLVLDEADRMLDMGFMPDIRRIIGLLPPKRQNLLFSATFSEEIRRLADGLLDHPVLVEVARRNTTAETITHIVHPVAEDEKRPLLAHLIRSRDLSQVLVFVATKLTCGRLARSLEKEGIAADSIHGDKSQQQREDALSAFKEGRIKVLVATDVAARGLDIEDLPHVVNYELPHTPEDYVHRIGRTGRAGKEGEAVSLVSPYETQRLVDIEKLIKREIPQHIVEGFDPGADWEYPPTGRKRSSARGGRGAPAAASRSEAAPSGRPPRERERDRDHGRSSGSRTQPVRTSHVAPDGFDFSKPYEPLIAANAAADTAATAGALVRPTRPGHKPRQIAALLGGIPKPLPVPSARNERGQSGRRSARGEQTSGTGTTETSVEAPTRTAPHTAEPTDSANPKPNTAADTPLGAPSALDPAIPPTRTDAPALDAGQAGAAALTVMTAERAVQEEPGTASPDEPSEGRSETATAFEAGGSRPAP